MIDFHSHILPAVDDGSRDVNESIELLKLLSSQGVKTVVATPHFYADNEASVDDFLKRRNMALDIIKQKQAVDLPEIICGAEVRYYSGISRMNDLKRLCIEGTGLLLLEMPMIRWTEYTVKEVLEISNRGGITLVMAHFERYMGYQPKKTIQRLYENGVLMQFNASFFYEFRTKRKAISMLKNGEVNFIGSDCHRTDFRPPKINRAFDIIQKKLGDDFLFSLFSVKWN